jgi:hypothetical protein
MRRHIDAARIDECTHLSADPLGVRDSSPTSNNLLQTPNLNLDSFRIPVQIRVLSRIDGFRPISLLNRLFSLLFLRENMKVPYPTGGGGGVKESTPDPATGTRWQVLSMHPCGFFNMAPRKCTKECRQNAIHAPMVQNN